MNFKSHFRFNKQERSGIFYLLLIIVVLQSGYFLLVMGDNHPAGNDFMVDTETQRQIDELKTRHLASDTLPLYPYNPNYISDFKGYTIGMSPQEIDRLHQFRSQHKFVNSAREFQQVTLVSDSLLAMISPFFKYPDWVINQNSSREAGKTARKSVRYALPDAPVGDLNSATVEELKRISGIGDVLASRIVKFRKALGGFLVAEQLYDVYGLEPEVVARAIQKFEVRVPPDITPINLNTASADELAKLLYINYELANRMVAYRDVAGGYKTFEELGNIADFPIEKIDRITLYLTL